MTARSASDSENAAFNFLSGVNSFTQWEQNVLPSDVCSRAMIGASIQFANG
jgi:hypothetical protein